MADTTIKMVIMSLGRTKLMASWTMYKGSTMISMAMLTLSEETKTKPMELRIKSKEKAMMSMGARIASLETIIMSEVQKIKSLAKETLFKGREILSWVAMILEVSLIISCKHSGSSEAPLWKVCVKTDIDNQLIFEVIILNFYAIFFIFLSGS